MFLVIAVFVVEAVRFLWLKQGWAGLLSTAPFYNPRTFDLRAIGTATSLAALTYIGFDGITTLAEDVKEPKRTVPLAVVLVCADHRRLRRRCRSIWRSASGRITRRSRTRTRRSSTCAAWWAGGSC